MSRGFYVSHWRRFSTLKIVGVHIPIDLVNSCCSIWLIPIRFSQEEIKSGCALFMFILSLLSRLLSTSVSGGPTHFFHAWLMLLHNCPSDFAHQKDPHDRKLDKLSVPFLPYTPWSLSVPSNTIWNGHSFWKESLKRTLTS